MAAAILASALLVLLSSLLVGRALARVLGSVKLTWIEPMLGFAVLVSLASASRLVTGSAVATAVVLGIVVVGSLIYLAVHAVRTGSISGLLQAARLCAPGVVIAGLLGFLPFAASGHIGPLGAGVNNDLASHLNWTAWLVTEAGPKPWGVEIGYPVGTHSIAAALVAGLGFEILPALLGVLVALPMLGAVLAMTVLAQARASVRALGGALIGMPYLFAGSFAIGSFKEIEMGLLLLSFAVALRELSKGSNRVFGGVALAVLFAGMLATYSYAAIGWVAATVGIWVVISLWKVHRAGGMDAVRQTVRKSLPVAAGSVALAVVISLVELSRSWALVFSEEVQVTSASRLEKALPIPEAFGAWPTPDFLGGLDTWLGWIVFGGLGLLVLCLGVRVAWKRGEMALVSALAASALLFLAALLLGSYYTQAKALTIPAALIMALALIGLADLEVPKLARRSLAAIFVAVAFYSSFLALREANVASLDRTAELEQIRQRIGSDGVLALTTDRYVDFNLQGAFVVSPAPFAELVVRDRPGKVDRLPVDFDSAHWPVSDLYDYALTTSATYQSAPSPDYVLDLETPSYRLWKRMGRGRPLNRTILPEQTRMGKILRCSEPRIEEILRTLSKKGNVIAHTIRAPFVGKRSAWTEGAKIGPGGQTSQVMRLGKGTWDLSFQYFSPSLGLTVTAPGLDRTLPADAVGRLQSGGHRGPYWPAGQISSDGSPVKLTVTADEQNWFQRLIGVNQKIEIGNLAAVVSGTERAVPAEQACGLYVDYFTFDPPKGYSLADPVLQQPALRERKRIGQRAFGLDDLEGQP